MSKLTDIKSKVLQLEGGGFQEFCDAFLVRKGYNSILELGMQAGTMKTTTGNPDTYFRSKSGKYILVAYTTQQSSIYRKIEEDILKCLDKEKTGIEVSDIEEIIYCHTSSNLSAGDDKKLHKICETKGIVLELYGVDRIANEIYYNYKSLAKDMLGISIDTNQILESQEFILQYDSNEMAAPISTKFQFREKEYREIFSALDTNKVIVVYGKAGTGKTRLTLEVARDYSENNNYKLYCIKSNDLSIAEDFAGAISKSGKYLIFIDDANELIGLKYVLEYLKMDYLGYEVKFIVTLRDYTKQKILEEIYNYTKPYLIEISRFSDEEIKQFLDVNMEIKNENYINQIIRIAEGNPRIAYMAGKLAKEEQKLSAIQDATQLYENYYNKYISNSLIATDRKLCLSAGIISLLHTINMEKIDILESIFKLVDITGNEFCNNINKLFTMEIIEIKYDKIAIITDQCLANYMLYYTFFKKKYIPFSDILNVGFRNFRNGITKTINILWNIFSSSDVHEYLEKEINKVWDQYSREDEVLLGKFIKVFHDFRPEEALLFIKDRSDKVENKEVDIDKIDFTKNLNRISDEILLMMTGYRYSELLPEAIELVIDYTMKKQDVTLETYYLFKTYYGISKYSSKNNYYTEKILANKLVQFTDNKLIYRLFIYMAKYLLSLKFTPTEVERGNKIVMYRIPVKYKEGSKEYRKVLWNKLICLSDKIECQNDILEILDEYSYGWNDEIDTEVVSYDFLFIYKIIEKLKDNNYLIVAKIYNQLIKMCKNYEVKITGEYDYIFKTNEWKLYSLFAEKHFEKDIAYEELDRLYKEKITKYADKVCDSDLENIVIICNKIVIQLPREECKINQGINIFAEALFDNYDRLMYFIKAYFKYGNNLNMYPLNIIKKLIKYMGTREVYRLIFDREFSQKNYWQYMFFEALPESEIDNDYLIELLDFFKLKTDEDISKSQFRSLRILDKFINIDSNIYCDVSKIIYDKKTYSKFIITTYFGLLFNGHAYKPEELLKLYCNDIELLQNIYFDMLEYNSDNDYIGEFIKAFIEVDKTWLIRYTNYMHNEPINYEVDRHYRLNACWMSDNYIEIFDYIFNSFVEKEDLYLWNSKEIFKNLLLDQIKEEEKANRQREWIFHTINENYNNDKIVILFEILSGLGQEIRKESINLFVSLNKDFSVFEKLTLESNCWVGEGSMIPYMQKRIEFYKSLLPCFTGLDLLQHKRLIKENIRMWEKRIEKEKVNEIFEDVYK